MAGARLLALLLHRTRAAAFALAAVVTWVLLLGFGSIKAVDVGLTVPVRYGRVQLRSRAPSVIKLDLPAGSFEVSPASLGYFDSPTEFIFTADEPRGLIYGIQKGEAVVIEIDTPVNADEFIDEYLARIRAGVNSLNRCENELLQARRGFASKADRARQLASLPLGQRTEELAAGGLDEWIDMSAEQGSAAYAGTWSALSQSALDRAELKRLYYAAQLKRIELLLAGFDLQIALARLPKPAFAGVLSVGDSGLVTETLTTQLSELDASWEKRRLALENQLRAETAWLELTRAGLPGPPAGSAALPEAAARFELTSMDGAIQVQQRRALCCSVLDARLQLAQAELAELRAAQEQLAAAARYVASGGTNDREVLPVVTVAGSELGPCRSDSIPVHVIEAEAVGAEQTAQLLLALAAAFEHDGRAGRVQLSGAANLSSLQPYPSEALLGIVAVDRRCRIERTGSAGSSELLLRMDEMLARPADFQAEDLNLGYLHFARWYAGLAARPAKVAGGATRAGQNVAGAVGDAAQAAAAGNRQD